MREDSIKNHQATLELLSQTKEGNTLQRRLWPAHKGQAAKGGEEVQVSEDIAGLVEIPIRRHERPAVKVVPIPQRRLMHKICQRAYTEYASVFPPQALPDLRFYKMAGRFRVNGQLRYGVLKEPVFPTPAGQHQASCFRLQQHESFVPSAMIAGRIHSVYLLTGKASKTGWWGLAEVTLFWQGVDKGIDRTASLTNTLKTMLPLFCIGERVMLVPDASDSTRVGVLKLDDKARDTFDRTEPTSDEQENPAPDAEGPAPDADVEGEGGEDEVVVEEAGEEGEGEEVVVWSREEWLRDQWQRDQWLSDQ
jgi:hypothetical protein